MKASIKFRDDDRPLMRAKVPIGVLGLPFQSGLSAGGDPRELRFDLSTAFASGPALRLSYRPNDPGLPFAISIRAGAGALGSPVRAPFFLAAEFNLLSANSGSPGFFLLLKPRLGDFSLSHTLRSSTSPPPRTVGVVSDGEGRDREDELSYKAFSLSGSGFAADVAAAGRSGGVGALLSGMRLTTRSVLPLWGRASMRFNWGIRAPPGLQAAFADDRKDARVPVCKMPLLVINKISIEQAPHADKKKDSKADVDVSLPAIDATDALDRAGHAADGEGFSLMRRQLEAMNAESGMLRRAVDELRTEIGRGRAASVAAVGRPPPQPHHGFSVKPDRRGGGKEPAAENSAMPAPDEVGEELKRALEARRR
ncbi:uncharacterized protein LOC119330504 [Triticum dicoccoides]|uniref:Uncharacterized protein n=2 Tax=Triticum TaxID=4564 RepID=A0A9R0ZBU6_TRITD|nr:uncharacterized protein LOC119330504 [Triticum dicoccoides]XP_044426932.1 uncharacterized protein LOC123151254 [Triticum aestivum]VAI73977.1 unnamed protein product [Triticum turgidum subsp. durum]